MIQVVTKCGNAGQYIERCEYTLKRQLYDQWRQAIVIDAATDDTFSRAAPFFQAGKIEIVYSKKKQWGMKSILDGIDILKPADEDIIAIYDGDDWLPREDVFNIVEKEYVINNCLLTYGSFSRESTGNKCGVSGKFAFDIPVRKQVWHGSHLKTFKYKLFKKIPDEYFRGPDGGYIQYCDDMVFMMAMVELAGHKKCVHIPEVLYVYNDLNPESSYYDENERPKVKALESWVREMQPLKQVF